MEINHFLYDFSVSCRAADLLLAVDDYVSATSHTPHIGTNFLVVMGFKLSPSEGVASRVLGYGGGQRQRQLMLINDVYCSGPGYGPEDSHIQLRRKEALQKNEHIMMQ